MNRIRQEKIREYIENKSVATIKELQAVFTDVSLMTIHRDLDALEEQGAIVKYRGGVKSLRHPDDIEFNVRMRENVQGKEIMAEKALSLIKNRSSIFLDAGTSNLILGKKIPDLSLNIITTGPAIAIELCRLHNPIVTVCCGDMNRKNMGISGKNALEMIDKINIDTAFIGVSGASSKVGFTCGAEADMLIKSSVIKKARVSVIMCAAEKLTRLMPYTFAHFSDVDYIITDKPLPKEFEEEAEKNGVVIL